MKRKNQHSTEKQPNVVMDRLQERQRIPQPLRRCPTDDKCKLNPRTSYFLPVRVVRVQEQALRRSVEDKGVLGELSLEKHLNCLDFETHKCIYLFKQKIKTNIRSELGNTSHK